MHFLYPLNSYTLWSHLLISLIILNGGEKKKVEMEVLPAKYAGLPCFNTQPGAESFKAGVFQQLHCSLQDP